MKLSLTLSFLLMITSCSSLITYNYSEDEFKHFLKVGAIEKVKPDFTCFKDNQLQTRAIYYNFYNMTVEQVYAYAEYIKEDFSVEGGHFRYETMTVNNNGTLIQTRMNGHANLYDKQIAVCTNAALVRKLNKRRNLDYSKRFPVHQTHFNISVKLTKNFVLDKFLRDKILHDKINQDLIKVNQNAPKFGPKVEYYCLDDQCSIKKQSNFISERRVNIRKEYSRNFLNGAKLLLNYSYISEAVSYILTLPKNSKLRCLYEETKVCKEVYRRINET